MTEHADVEMSEDEIYNEELYESVLEGEILEEYPDDAPFPSCLVHGEGPSGDPIHSVWAYSEEDEIATLITCYRPDPDRWIDFRERR